MADITLVPQRRVLERGEEVTTHYPGEATHPLGEDRVTLVRHRRASLLFLAEGFERLADLAALKVADLGRDSLQGPGSDGQRGHVAGMAVARHDLRRDDVDLEAQLAADMLLDARIDGCVCADGPADPAHPCFFGCALQASDRAVELGHPARDLEPKRDRLGDDAVGAASHQGAAVADRDLGRRLTHGAEVADDEPRGLHHLHRHRGVVQVLARHSQVHVAGLGLANGFVEHREEGDHVVAYA